MVEEESNAVMQLGGVNSQLQTEMATPHDPLGAGVQAEKVQELKLLAEAAAPASPPPGTAGEAALGIASAQGEDGFVTGITTGGGPQPPATEAQPPAYPYAMSCCVMLCRVVSCCVVLCHVVSCCVVLCCVVLCCVMLCRVVLCCVVSCRVVLCCVVLCCVVLV